MAWDSGSGKQLSYWEKRMEEQTIDGVNDDAFGYNITLGLNYFFEKYLYIDTGLRYTDDKLNLGLSDATRTGGLNFFLGVGFSFHKK